jgi:type VI secretion system protein ImpH
VVGPRTLAEDRRLLPGSPALQSLAEVVRRYVGPELDFEVRLILKREEVPGARLGVGGAQLGWTSFMTAEPPPRDVVGARFEFTQIDYPAAYSAAAG